MCSKSLAGTSTPLSFCSLVEHLLHVTLLSVRLGLNNLSLIPFSASSSVSSLLLHRLGK